MCSDRIVHAYHYKRLCPPKGAGLLYARPDMQNLFKSLVLSWGYESKTPGDSVFEDHHEWWGSRVFIQVDLAALKARLYNEYRIEIPLIAGKR